jgi:hypothetical protein
LPSSIHEKLAFPDEAEVLDVAVLSEALSLFAFSALLSEHATNNIADKKIDATNFKYFIIFIFISKNLLIYFSVHEIHYQNINQGLSNFATS